MKKINKLSIISLLGASILAPSFFTSQSLQATTQGGSSTTSTSTAAICNAPVNQQVTSEQILSFLRGFASHTSSAIGPFTDAPHFDQLIYQIKDYLKDLTPQQFEHFRTSFTAAWAGVDLKQDTDGNTNYSPYTIFRNYLALMDKYYNSYNNLVKNYNIQKFQTQNEIDGHVKTLTNDELMKAYNKFLHDYSWGDNYVGRPKLVGVKVVGEFVIPVIAFAQDESRIPSEPDHSYYGPAFAGRLEHETIAGLGNLHISNSPAAFNSLTTEQLKPVAGFRTVIPNTAEDQQFPLPYVLKHRNGNSGELVLDQDNTNKLYTFNTLQLNGTFGQSHLYVSNNIQHTNNVSNGIISYQVTNAQIATDDVLAFTGRVANHFAGPDNLNNFMAPVPVTFADFFTKSNLYELKDTNYPVVVREFDKPNSERQIGNITNTNVNNIFQYWTIKEDNSRADNRITGAINLHQVNKCDEQVDLSGLQISPTLSSQGFTLEKRGFENGKYVFEIVAPAKYQTVYHFLDGKADVITTPRDGSFGELDLNTIRGYSVDKSYDTNTNKYSLRIVYSPVNSNNVRVRTVYLKKEVESHVQPFSEKVVEKVDNGNPIEVGELIWQTHTTTSNVIEAYQEYTHQDSIVKIQELVHDATLVAGDRILKENELRAKLLTLGYDLIYRPGIEYRLVYLGVKYSDDKAVDTKTVTTSPRFTGAHNLQHISGLTWDSTYSTVSAQGVSGFDVRYLGNGVTPANGHTIEIDLTSQTKVTNIPVELSRLVNKVDEPIVVDGKAVTGNVVVKNTNGVYDVQLSNGTSLAKYFIAKVTQVNGKFQIVFTPTKENHFMSNYVFTEYILHNGSQLSTEALVHGDALAMN